MTTQYTPTLKLALPVTGELSGTWGDIVNDNITSMIEQAIAGLATINTWTGNAHTLTTANGTTSESRCAMLVAATGGGAPTAAAEIICPAAAKLYVLQNNTSYAVTLKTSAGTGVAVAAGDTAFLFCDGTNVNSCVTTIVNGHITGNLTVDGNATINGNTTLGNATSDTVTVTARVASNVLPSADNTYDLGASANAWKDVYIDGTAYLALVDINGGTIDGVSIGASTAATIINVDNLRLDGNTLSSTDTNGNVVIAPNGTGDVQLDADTVRVGDSGAAAILTSNGAGALTVTTGGAADLTLSTNSGTDSGTVVIANGVNGNITLTPNGTGDVILSADRVQIGDANTDTTLTTNGTGSLNLTTNNGTNSGTIQIAQGANGNITLTPNGTGSVSVPKLVWSNGTATRVPYLTTGGQFTDSANMTFDGTTLTVAGLNNTGNTTLGNASGDTVTVTGTITSNLIFTDNTYDIGASGATRPRNLYLAGDATIGGSIAATTLDLTNLEVTNIKAKDGTAAMTIADSTGAVTVSSAFSTQGNTTLGNAAADNVTVTGTITSNLIFTDNTYDIGASGATRPRSMFLGTNLTVGNNITVGTAAGSEYIYKPGTDTATGVLRIQAGAGSAAYGGGLVLYSHSNATNPGWVVAGLSTGAAAKFAVNNWGIGGGTDVFTVDTTGLGYFAGNVAINTTPAAWTDASALLVSNYAAYGQRNIGNSDGVISWNAQWSGGASGAGYTYRVTGDVASAYEQNGAHRFYTTPTAGTAGGAISLPVRLAISAAGYTYINYQGTALANLNILTNGAGGGIQLNRNTSGTNPTVGQSLGQYAWKGTDSANTNNASEAMIEAVAAENFTGSTAATNLLFYTKSSGVGPGSAPSFRGGINYAGQWVIGGGAVSPDGNAKLTLYTGNGTNEGLSIYETSTGNNARLRIYQASAAVVYDATYSSGGNSHNFQVGSGTAFSVNSGVAVLGSSSPLSWFGGNVLQGPSFAINQVAGVDQTVYVTGAYQPTYVGSWLARGAYRASMYQQVSGGHAFFTNGTTPGGAGSTVSFTQAVTIDSNGFVGINQPSPTTYLEIGGSGEMLRLDGSSGTNRSIYLRNVGSGDATLLTDGTLNLTSNAAYAINLQTQSTSRVRVTSDGNMLQLTGRKSNAYTMGNMQEWVGSVTSIADGASFSLFAINNIYDNLSYELSMFVNAGGFFAYKSAGVFGYNGFTNTVLGSSTSQTITRTGALYNETMTITNNQGGTVIEYFICLRVWGLSQSVNVSSGGQDCVTSSFLTRIQ